MEKNTDWKDLTIRWDGHQKYVKGKIFEDDLMEVIVQKLEMILFTNTTEVYGQDGFELGADLEYYLWETKISNDIIKSKITQQINQFLPELNMIGYDMWLKIYPGEVQDIMEINITIKGYNLSFVFA